jgi:tRNA-dihydrouridine synthase
MRLVARRRGCPYAVTEALLDVILLSGGQGLRKSIDINDEDHPTAGQLIGSEPESMAAAARILAERGYDVIDLNYACPVKKIKNKARGGHMLRDVPRAVAMLRAVRDVVPADVPTTLSLRRGFDDTPGSAELFYEIAEAAWAYGYSALRVHGRTVEQKYSGRANWNFLRDVKRRYPDRTILGSGDVFTAEDAVRMYRETGVDMVWIARGAIGNPWIFGQTAALLTVGATPALLAVGAMPASPVGQANGAPPLSQDIVAANDTARRLTGPTSATMPRATQASPLQAPTIREQRDALAEHFAIAMQIHGEQMAGRRMRKMGIKYSRFHPEAGQVKREFIEVKSLRDWTAVLTKWYATDGPGVWPDPSSANEVNGASDLEGCEAALV